MLSTEPLWKWLESRPGRTAVMAQWRTYAGGLLRAVQSMLTPLERRATAYPNPHGGLPLRIVRHADGSVVAVDKDDWHHRVDLQPEDEVLYQLDLRALRTALCKALDGVNIAKTPVDQATRCLQLGNWEPKKAASFPVYLLLCQHRDILRNQVLQLQAHCKRPGAILLTPSRMNWDSDIDALARCGKMLLVPMSEIIKSDGSDLFETDAWEEYLHTFAQMVALELPSNYRNKKPVPMRSTRTANIEKLEKELERHLISVRDHAHSLRDRGLAPVLLPRPEQKKLAKQTGLTRSDVSRCLSDSRATVLKLLWDTADSLKGVMNYKSLRRR